MFVQRTRLSSAILSTLPFLFHPAAAANTAENTNQSSLPTITISASPLNAHTDTQAPVTVLSGEALRNKTGTSLGDTLAQELGVAASSFGAGASRPIIRGMEGPRVQILENGMPVADVSSLSNDHAVAAESAQQIEILRGPAALLYGSGAIGGLVNLVNDRIPLQLHKTLSGEAETRYSSVDDGKNALFLLNGSTGPIGLHLDGNWRETGNYKIPGNINQNDRNSAWGNLPNSFSRTNEFGAGGTYFANWGYLGASIASLDKHYGIPTAEKSFIDLHQIRSDIAGQIDDPFTGFEKLTFKLGYTDYTHTEKQEDGHPNTIFSNQSTQTRWQLTHRPLAGGHGNLGLQTEEIRFSALAANTGLPDTVPRSRSTSFAGFLVEERDFGSFLTSAGVRLESVQRRPDAATGLMNRQFDLASYSLSALWRFKPGYGFGPTVSIAQRAPALEELYSNGPHESTATFDIGDPALKKENSRNLELTLQKTEGTLRWKANLFINHIRNYVYGRNAGQVDENGIPEIDGEFTERFWSQANATLRGAEVEISHNLDGPGLSVRGFADMTHGTLENMGYLPLQPATRYGIDVGYRQGAWRSGMTILHAQQQDRLASFERNPTPAYTNISAQLSYTQTRGKLKLTWFALAKNLLNQDIRFATSVLKDIAPQPGRSVILGVRTQF